jgi:predicted NBD/HSP70 family sugar kinase
MAPKVKYLMGIDLGGRQLRFILAEQKTGNIFTINSKSSKRSFLSPFNECEDIYADQCFTNIPNKEKVAFYITKKLQKYLEEVKISKNDIVGVGIAVAGRLQGKGCFIGSNVPLKYANKTNISYGIDLVATLKKYFSKDIDIVIENDATCAGLVQAICYEQMGIDPQKTFFITVSTGIGGGGPKRDLDEIGHIIVDGYFPGLKPLCGCGTYGCIEAFASGEGIKKQALTILELYFNQPHNFEKFNTFENIRTKGKHNLKEIIIKSKLTKLFQDKKDINAKIIFGLANLDKKRKQADESRTCTLGRDEFAYYLIDTAADRFAKVLIDISRIHGIERFGIDGSVVTNNPKYLDLVQKKINLYDSNCIFGIEIKVELAPLGDYTTDYGALFLVVDPAHKKKWIDTMIKLQNNI